MNVASILRGGLYFARDPVKSHLRQGYTYTHNQEHIETLRQSVFNRRNGKKREFFGLDFPWCKFDDQPLFLEL